jgi:hypothetical protein
MSTPNPAPATPEPNPFSAEGLRRSITHPKCEPLPTATPPTAQSMAEELAKQYYHAWHGKEVGDLYIAKSGGSMLAAILQPVLAKLVQESERLSEHRTQLIFTRNKAIADQHDEWVRQLQSELITLRAERDAAVKERDELRVRYPERARQIQALSSAQAQVLRLSDFLKEAETDSTTLRAERDAVVTRLRSIL